MSAMSNYIRARHNLTDNLVTIPLAWLDTSLSDVYTIEEEGVKPEEVEAAPATTRRGRNKITEENLGEVQNEGVKDTFVNDEDEETNE